MMARIEHGSLLSLEAYARERNAFRAQVIEHKKVRTVGLGDHITLIFEEDGIRQELDAYNPLVPDGSNLKATMMIEYPDVAERQRALAQLKGIEDRVWMQVGGLARVYAIADEDLERENAEKTSAVHFLRFEFDEGMRKALRGGAQLRVGVDHPQYQAQTVTPAAVRDALAADLA